MVAVAKLAEAAGAETMKQQVEEHDGTGATELLLSLRRRLVEKVSRAILSRRSELLAAVETDGSPFRLDCGTEALVSSLSQLQQVIAALRESEGNHERQTESVPTARSPKFVAGGRTFERFTSLVSADKLEEATRELGRIFQMPVDRAGTATRFFARAARAKPELENELSTLCQRIFHLPASQGIRLLMTVFGFQAVESQMAREALQAQHRRPATAVSSSA